MKEKADARGVEALAEEGREEHEVVVVDPDVVGVRVDDLMSVG